ncbi:MAG: hypothetical protein SH868_19510 [Bythopirellula sp.]|nr:hypothetical protein [Bythopirellula sp.]
MLRRQLFSLLTVLAVLLLSGLNQSESHAARCCRAKQKSSCCACQPTTTCCQPCEECYECRAGCICIDYVFYGFPGYYLHYAKSYPNSNDCTQYTTVIHQDTSILSQTTCPNCPLPARYNTTSVDCLPDAVPADYDIELRVIAPDYQAVKYLMGEAKLPDGSSLKARLLLLKVKVGKPGQEHLELFAFGFQAKELPTGPNELANPGFPR